MKRIVTTCILAVLILAVCIYGQYATGKCVDSIQKTMEQIDDKLSKGDTEAALQQSKMFLDNWEKLHGQMCFFLQHEHLDPLESVFAVLPYYIEQEEITLARAECKTVCTLTDHILKSERVDLENIL